MALAGNTLTIGSATLSNGAANTLFGGGILNTNVLGGTISGGTLAFAGTGEGIALNGLVAGGLASKWFNISGVSQNDGGTTFIGPAADFGQVNFEAANDGGQRIDPDINYILPSAAALGVLGGVGGTAGGPVFAGGNGQPLNTLPSGVLSNGTTVGVVWSGYLNIVRGGLYNIINYNVDNNARIFIDGQLVIYGYNANIFNDFVAGDNGQIYASALQLAPGLHTFYVQYVNTGGDGALQIEYQGPDTNNQAIIIPGAASLTSPGFVAAGELNLNCTIAANTSLTMAGGQVDLPVAQNYSGNTYVDGTILNVGSSAGLGGKGTLVLNAGTLESTASVNLPNPFVLSGGTVTFFGQNNITLSGPGVVTGANTIIADSTGLSQITGVLSGTGSLTVTQTGQATINGFSGINGLILTGANTYSGGTTLTAGSLLVAGSSSGTTSSPVGTGTLTLLGGTLYADSQARTLSNPVVLSGSVTLSPSSYGGSSSSGSTLTFSGAATLAGNTNLNVIAADIFSAPSAEAASSPSPARAP